MARSRSIHNQTRGLFETAILDAGNIYLQLSEGEATAGTDSSVVSDGRASHNGSEEIDRARSDGSSLGTAGVSSGGLLAGL